MPSPPRKSPDLAPPVRLRYLDGVVEYLWDARNLRGLVCLVERWSSVEPPSRTGRMFQVRGYLALRLMDRAWLLLKRLMEEEPGDPTAAGLAVEMFLDRGWLTPARKVVSDLEALRPQDPAVARLRALCEGPARTPPANAREIEQRGSPAELLDLAERFLATGSFLRARALLERLKTAEPANGRVKDLLWALDGDFEVGDIRPEDLAAQLAPTFRDHGHLGAVDLEPPGAEEVTATRIPLEDDDPHDAEFPALFRRLGQVAAEQPDDDTGEVTQARTLAGSDDLGAGAETSTSGGIDPSEHRREDTEIMMVIPKGGAEPVDLADARVHRKRTQDYDLRATLDLQDYRRHMGVSAPSLSDLTTEPEDTEDESDPVSLEDEDADLVVLTRREAGDRPQASAPAPRPGPIRVIEKHPIPETEAQPEVLPAAPVPVRPVRPPPPAAAPPAHPAPPPEPGSGTRVPPPGTAAPAPARPAPAPVRPAPPPARPQVRPPPPRAGEPDEPTTPVRRGRRPGGALLALAALTVAVVLGGMVALGLPPFGAGRAVQAVERAIDSDRYGELLKVEGNLERRLPPDAADADPALLAAAARVQLALWSGHQPYPERFEETHALVARAVEGDAPRIAQLAAAELAAWEWRVEDAERALAAYAVEDADALLVRSALATCRADRAEALRVARLATEREPGSARAWRTLAELLVEEGAADDAKAAAARLRTLDPTSPRLAIVELLVAHLADPGTLPAEARTLAVDLAERYVPPRTEALLFETVSRQLPGNATAAAREWALQQAFAKDATDPDLLAWSGRKDAEAGRLLAALKKLQKAVHFRPGDPALRLALVRILLDLDRVADAEAQVAELGKLRPGHADIALLSAWIAVVDSLPRGGAETQARVEALLGPRLAADDGDGEARWLVGIAMLGAARPGALDALTRAAQQLLDSQDPADRELVPRALASLVFAGHPGTVKLLEHLSSSARADPWAQLFLAWSEAQHGQRSRAAGHLAQAVEVSPEMARAHWERARFCGEGSRDLACQRAAVQRYLALDPNGQRAREARAGR